MCYNAVMRRDLKKCLDSIEICGRKLKCRFDLNNWHVMHTHDFWEIMLITEGTYQQTINGKNLTLQKNHALLIKPTDVHCVHPGKATDAHINIVINCEFMHSVCDFFDDTLYHRLLVAAPQPLYLSTSQFRSIADIVNEMQLYPLNAQPDSLKRMLLSFYLNLHQIQLHLTNKHFPEEFKNVLSTLSLPQNLALTVTDIAELAGYSYSHFAKLFKKFIGVTASEYLTNIKMEYAAFALLKLNTPVTQLALDLGYQSFGYFTNLFKKHYGVPPSQYKKSFTANSGV